MISPKEQLAELSALVQIFLMQNYERKDWLLADSETYHYFKQQVQTQKVKPLPPPAAATPPIAPALKAPPVTVPAPSLPETPPPVPEEPVMKKESPKARAPEAKKADKPKEFFVLEPMAAPQPLELSDIRSFMSEKFSGIKILDPMPQVPKHLIARSIPAVAVFSFQETGVDRAFLQQVSQAVQRALAPAEMWEAADIERRQEWDKILSAPELKLIVASAHGMHRFPLLMQHYREVNKGGRIFFGKVPALLLTDLSVYRKEPQLKAALWKSLKEMLSVEKRN